MCQCWVFSSVRCMCEWVSECVRRHFLWFIFSDDVGCRNAESLGMVSDLSVKCSSFFFCSEMWSSVVRCLFCCCQFLIAIKSLHQSRIRLFQCELVPLLAAAATVGIDTNSLLLLPKRNWTGFWIFIFIFDVVIWFSQNVSNCFVSVFFSSSSSPLRMSVCMFVSCVYSFILDPDSFCCQIVSLFSSSGNFAENNFGNEVVFRASESKEQQQKNTDENICNLFLKFPLRSICNDLEAMRCLFSCR